MDDLVTIIVNVIIYAMLTDMISSILVLRESSACSANFYSLNSITGLVESYKQGQVQNLPS